MPVGEFRGISMRKELVDEVEQFIKDFGRYKSVTDFVTEATRLRLEELQKQYQNFVVVGEQKSKEVEE